MSRKPQKNRKSVSTIADRADKFACYQGSVQTPEHEIEFFARVFREEFGREPVTLREDFCGTFAVCCHWVASNKKRSAVAVDLCPETLRWGRENNLARLSKKQQTRVEVLEQDVRAPGGGQVDVLAAQNFSFWIFKTRAELVEYFVAARSHMADESVMVMDMMGGYESMVEDHVEKRTIRVAKDDPVGDAKRHGRKFKYHWEQRLFNPITGDATFAISFKFKDGSKLKRVFQYDWRFWTLPEVREILLEAGFRYAHVYWEGTGEDGDGNGEYDKSAEASSDPAWVCYVVAVK